MPDARHPNMLFRQDTLDGIRAGTVTVAFRRWTRPSVRAGGTLLTPIGQLEIVSVDPIDEDAITEQDAGRAGFASRRALIDSLGRRPSGLLFRIALGRLLADPRVALRDRAPNDADLTDLAARLRRLDDRSRTGPWTTQVLRLLAGRPGVRAGDLALLVSMDRDAFKVNVRKLKAVGLTESLGVGYRLSRRGQALLDRIDRQ